MERERGQERKQIQRNPSFFNESNMQDRVMEGMTHLLYQNTNTGTLETSRLFVCSQIDSDDCDQYVMFHLIHSFMARSHSSCLITDYSCPCCLRTIHSDFFPYPKWDKPTKKPVEPYFMLDFLSYTTCARISNKPYWEQWEHIQMEPENSDHSKKLNSMSVCFFLSPRFFSSFLTLTGVFIC